MEILLSKEWYEKLKATTKIPKLRYFVYAFIIILPILNILDYYTTVMLLNKPPEYKDGYKLEYVETNLLISNEADAGAIKMISGIEIFVISLIAIRHSTNIFTLSILLVTFSVLSYIVINNTLLLLD